MRLVRLVELGRSNTRESGAARSSRESDQYAAPLNAAPGSQSIFRTMTKQPGSGPKDSDDDEYFR